jgi:O-antigen ligase
MERVAERRRGRSRAREGRTGEVEPRNSRPQIGALSLFGLLIVIAPLAFGAVDRFVQVILAAVFAVALLAAPPSMPVPGRGMRWTLTGLAAILVLKEFAPATFFGATEWRTSFAQQYGIAFPVTHHPEPGRAVDAWLEMILAGFWFIWVRSLAGRRENRPWLLWCIAAAGAIVAGVSFFTAGIDPKAIYGLRVTPGWFGFGPFPNRNHTACFLAMSLVACFGCTAWAARRHRWPLVLLGGMGIALMVAGLLQTQSRGGLLAFLCGVGLFAALVVAKYPDRRAIFVAVAFGLVVIAGVLAFGETALGRFSSAGGDQSNASRMMIWQDAFRLWMQAPIFGHGVGSFSSVFPLVQTITLDNQIVLHPESSWLQWLVEFGALPLTLAALLAIAALIPFIRELYRRQTSFFLLAAAFAAGMTLLLHALIDVPVHRWGTAMLGLAALAVVCPAPDSARRFPRQFALIPVAIAASWSLPLVENRPPWSPTSLARTLDRSRTSTVPEERLREMLTWFPLDSSLHQLLGAELLSRYGRLAPHWERHLQAAVRLRPGSWATPLEVARICRGASPGHSFHFWQMALDRSGWRREELFGRAITETRDLPGAMGTWEAYAEAHPALLLIFAIHDSGESEKHFSNWWTQRAGAQDLGRGEVQAFYSLAGRIATTEQILEWARLHPELREADYLVWAGILHARGAHAEAWELIRASVPEPQYPEIPPTESLAQLDRARRISPDNAVSAQALAHALSLAGDEVGSETVVLETAQRSGSPEWFRAKAAHLLARDQRFAEAVSLLLKTE